ncbi:MAG: DNRLRE domain-containing protein [Candidatus Diapherotrites archaeon]|nr:DNRLRE domain-containing protein [Candidatus Diapherotrites archaeon]
MKSENFLLVFALALLAASVIFFFTNSNQPLFTASFAGERVTQRFGECASCDVKNVAMDAVLDDGSPNSSSGSAASLYYRNLGGNKHVIMRFDVSSIPAGATIHSARLVFFRQNDYLTDNSAGLVEIKQPIYKIVDSAPSGIWVESQATYNSKKSGVGWNGAGNITSSLGSQIGFVFFRNWLSGSQAFYTVDLTNAVKDWVASPSSNNGFYFASGPYYNKSFYSKEAASENLRPYLEVTFDGTNPESIPQPAGITAKFWKGQTFITWKEAQTDKNETTYRIYRYSQPITSSNINQAQLLDEVYQGSSYVSASLYGGTGAIKQPSLSKAGVSLSADSGLYVYTVESNGSNYYAVTTVVEGNEKQIVTAGQNATASPVSESIGIPDAFLYEHDSYNYYYSGYIMWLGSFNPKNTADNYGFFNKRSIPVFFAVTLPYKTGWDSSNPENMAKFSNSTPGMYALTLYLHASGKGYFQSEEGVDNSRNVDANRYGGFDLAFNDFSRIVVKKADGSLADLGPYIETDSYGYHYYAGFNSNYAPNGISSGFKKSIEGAKPYSDGKSVVYAEKQVKFIAEWMLYNSPWAQYMDPNRVYCTGGSMGAGGCLAVAIHNPEMIAALHSHQGRPWAYGGANYTAYSDFVFGKKAANIPTPEGIGIDDYLDLAKYLQANPNKDYPPMRTNHGKNDTTISWGNIPAFYSAANNAKVALTGYFDQCSHNCFEAASYTTGSAYFPEVIYERFFVKNQFMNSFDNFHYALNKSYPTFTDFSLNGNPGNGDPANSDLRGQINGLEYFDRNTLVDSSGKYEVTVYLVPTATAESATVTITPKRMQSFPHNSGNAVTWKNIAADGVTVLQSGTVTANSNGWYSISNFQILKAKSKLQLLSGAPGDTTPPAVPSSFRSTGKDSNNVALAWNANSESDLSAYKIYKNSSFLSTVLKPNVNYTASGLTANTNYNFQISAIDTSGNESAKSAGLSVTTDPQATTCTLPQILCGASCITPACTSSAQCNDSNPNTTDTCNNAGTCTANCTHTPISPGGVTYVVEPVEGIDLRYSDTNHVKLSYASGIPPAKCSYYTQPETGIKIWRMTEVNDNPSWGTAVGSDRNLGYYNGYSTYTNVNINGQYAITFKTNGTAAVYRLTDCTYLREIPVGETGNPRWDLSGDAGTETTIYYHYVYGGKVIKKDVVANTAAQTVFDLESIPEFAGKGAFIHSADHSDQSARYLGIRIRYGSPLVYKVGIVDLKNKVLLPVVLSSDGEGDISPDGVWLNVASLYYSSKFYRISDLVQGISTNYASLPTLNWGHAGWAFDYNGDPVYVYQNNSNDYMEAFNPKTLQLTKTLNLAELDGFDSDGVGQHISRIYNPAKKGWFLMGAYSHPAVNGRIWSSNQIFMIEIKPVKDGAGKLLPLGQRARIWRIASEPNSYQVGAKEPTYFTEGFVNIDPQGNNVYVGGNWNGNDNLELYKIELPTNWEQTLDSGTPPITCYDLTSDHKVNVFDLTFVALRIGQPAGNPADVVGNDGVNIQDLQAVARNFGQTC